MGKLIAALKKHDAQLAGGVPGRAAA